MMYGKVNSRTGDDMQIIYTCPNCGGDLSEIMIATNPPIYTKVCHNCGWSVEEPRESIVRIPYAEEAVLKTHNNNPCRMCGNNPENGGNGICNCILGNKIIY